MLLSCARASSYLAYQVEVIMGIRHIRIVNTINTKTVKYLSNSCGIFLQRNVIHSLFQGGYYIPLKVVQAVNEGILLDFLLSNLDEAMLC
jgi:hypothetical protein